MRKFRRQQRFPWKEKTAFLQCLWCEVEYGNQRWEDDFSFTLTFHSCQADTYELGGIEISSDPDSDRPELQRYESELLEMLGLPEAHYRITDYAWAGEAYQDEGGALCRDACARGERLVRDCQAVYGGEVVLSPKKGLEDEGSVPPERRGRAEAASFRAGSEKNEKTGRMKRQSFHGWRKRDAS